MITRLKKKKLHYLDTLETTKWREVLGLNFGRCVKYLEFHRGGLRGIHGLCQCANTWVKHLSVLTERITACRATLPGI